MAVAILVGSGGGGIDCDDATATVADVYTGLTFGGAASDSLQTGTMPNIGAQTGTIGAPTGSQQAITIKKGYHNGKGVISQNISDRGSPSITLAVNDTYTIPAGWYTGGSISQTVTQQGATTLTPGTSQQKVSAKRYMTGNVVIQGDSNLVASSIKKGVKIWGVTGTVVDYASQQEEW